MTTWVPFKRTENLFAPWVRDAAAESNELDAWPLRSRPNTVALLDQGV